MSPTRNVSTSRIAYCYGLGPRYLTSGERAWGIIGLGGRYQKSSPAPQTGDLFHSRTGGAFAVCTTACTLPFIIRENVLRCSLWERNPLDYPLSHLLHYFQNLRGFKISLISCLRGCVPSAFKDSIPGCSLSKMHLCLKICFWKVSHQAMCIWSMSIGNLLNELCVAQEARFFREKIATLCTHISFCFLNGKSSRGSGPDASLQQTWERQVPFSMVLPAGGNQRPYFENIKIQTGRNLNKVLQMFRDQGGAPDLRHLKGAVASKLFAGSLLLQPQGNETCSPAWSQGSQVMTYGEADFGNPTGTVWI